MKNITIILAGGTGNRIDDTTPKQYIRVGGETILLHTLRVFDAHPDIDAIYIVCGKQWEDCIRAEVSAHDITKVAGYISSGSTSFESLINGINALSDVYSDAHVLVHESVRPLVSHDIISRNIITCREKGNAITAIATQEALLQSADGQAGSALIPREGLWRTQTPVTFPLSTLRKMRDEAARRGITFSQSLFTLAHETGFLPLNIVQGDIRNFKITYKEDIDIYRALISSDARQD